MKIFIVDDEQSSRENIRQLVSKYFPEYEICSEAQDVASAYELLQIHKPDLVLLDIDLPDGNAFDLLSKFQEIDFIIIFITAYEQYALKAIKFSALDFLLKPFGIEEFTSAVQKAARLRQKNDMQLSIAALLQNMQPQQTPSKIVLRTSDSIHIVPIDEIVRLQSEGAYCTFHCLGRKPIIVSRNLKEFDSLLEKNNFIRTHQSHLVNSKFIVLYHKNDGGWLVLTDKSQVPVATRFRDKVLQAIERI